MILLTGGTGGLGRSLIAALKRTGQDVRVLARGTGPEGVETVKGDLLTGAGLVQGLAGVDTLLHAASNFKEPERVDVEGTQRLLAAAAAAKISHFLYVSIVGIEKVSTRYYRAKLAAEAAVSASPVPWTIFRATQFHSLIDTILSTLSWMPVRFLPTSLKFQPIDSAAVSARLAELTHQSPAGRVADLGGPQVLTLGELGRTWLQIRGQRRPICPVPTLGSAAAAIRAGGLTCPDQASNTLSWADWVSAKYAG